MTQFDCKSFANEIWCSFDFTDLRFTQILISCESNLFFLRWMTSDKCFIEMWSTLETAIRTVLLCIFCFSSIWDMTSQSQA